MPHPVTRSLCKRFLPTRLTSSNHSLARCQVIALALSSLLLSGCALISPASNDMSLLEPISHPVRFLLTFDDGPSASSSQNPTASILHDLEHNPVQPGIKALFFVQTRGATLRSPGRELLPREHADGHLIGFHTATSGHHNHRFLSHEEFITSLENGITDIHKVTGSAPKLVRPPFWSYDARTFDAYQMHGMHLLLTDLSANDGKIWGFNGSPRRRINLYNQLATMRPKMVVGRIPVVDNVLPIVVTFHDTNPYTARHLHEYLQILLEVAAELNIPVSPQPFYQDKAELERAALARTIKSESEVVVLPGIWSWIWGTNPDRGRSKLASFN
jgi:peptidoglycan/xylan/chitin deacetylase (PgdA/CDA1 family)